MTFQANPEAILFLVAAVVSGLLAFFAWRRRSLAMAPAFAVMMTGETVWALSQALELLVVEMAAKQAFYELRNAGAVTAILGLLAVVLRYTGHVEWLKLPVFTAVCTPAVVMILFAWTNDWHHFYWYRHEAVIVGGFAFARPVYAPGFWVHFTYCYGLVAASTILLAQAVVQSAGIYRIQAAVMLFGVLLPWFVNMVDMSQVLGEMHSDTAAMTFAVTGLGFLPAVLRYRLLEVTPVAWATVVSGMNDPVLVIDPLGRIVELNEAAHRLSGRPLEELVGFDVARSFSCWPELAKRLEKMPEEGESSFELSGPEPAAGSAFDGRISRLGGEGELLGWVVVLRDISAHKRAGEERVRVLFEQSARAEAEAANRAKDRFLAMLSHELRTPLTPVLAAVSGMLGDATTPGSLRIVLEMIRRNITLEARLIDDLLDLARIRRGTLDLKREIVSRTRLDQARDRDLRERFPPGRDRAGSRAWRPAPPRGRGPDPLAAGALEPDQERDQVHSRRRAGHGAHARRRTARGLERWQHPGHSSQRHGNRHRGRCDRSDLCGGRAGGNERHEAVRGPGTGPHAQPLNHRTARREAQCVECRARPRCHVHDRDSVGARAPCACTRQFARSGFKRRFDSTRPGRAQDSARGR